MRAQIGRGRDHFVFEFFVNRERANQREQYRYVCGLGRADANLRHQPFSTSRMLYRPAGLARSQTPARAAPCAKFMRFDALWLISPRSPSPRNNPEIGSTSCKERVCQYV